MVGPGWLAEALEDIVLAPGVVRGQLDVPRVHGKGDRAGAHFTRAATAEWLVEPHDIQLALLWGVNVGWGQAGVQELAPSALGSEALLRKHADVEVHDFPDRNHAVLEQVQEKNLSNVHFVVHECLVAAGAWIEVRLLVLILDEASQGRLGGIASAQIERDAHTPPGDQRGDHHMPQTQFHVPRVEVQGQRFKGLLVLVEPRDVHAVCVADDVNSPVVPH